MAFSVPDKTTFAIGLRPGRAARHEVWDYNNSAIQTLQVVLKKATGIEPADYAQQVHLRPARHEQHYVGERTRPATP